MGIAPVLDANSAESKELSEQRFKIVYEGTYQQDVDVKITLYSWKGLQERYQEVRELYGMERDESTTIWGVSYLDMDSGRYRIDMFTPNGASLQRFLHTLGHEMAHIIFAEGPILGGWHSQSGKYPDEIRILNAPDLE